MKIKWKHPRSLWIKTRCSKAIWEFSSHSWPSEECCVSQEWTCLSISAMFSYCMRGPCGSMALVKLKWNILELRGCCLCSIKRPALDLWGAFSQLTHMAYTHQLLLELLLRFIQLVPHYFQWFRWFVQGPGRWMCLWIWYE